MEHLLPTTRTERAIIGACIIDNEAVKVARERLHPDLFFSYKCKRIFESVVSIPGELDIIALSQHLESRKLLTDIGGTAFLAEIASENFASSAIHTHIDSLIDKAAKRKIWGILEGLKSDLDSESDSNQLLHKAKEELFKLSITSLNDPVEIAAILEQIMSRIHSKKQDFGIGTGFSSLDMKLGGWHKQDLVIIGARPSMGKAQPLNEKVLTPNGFVEIGDLSVGDIICGTNGYSQAVTGIFYQGMLPVYRVTMSDGTSTECCAEHLWFTQTRNERRRGIKGSVKRLADIEPTLRRGDGGNRNHVLPTYTPVEFADCGERKISPYLLGLLLGDGKLRTGNIHFHKPEPDLQASVIRMLPPEDTALFIKGGLRIKRKKRNNHTSELANLLSYYGLRVGSKEKFIPKEYLFGPTSDRWDVLLGLIDTDGSVIDSGNAIEYSTSSPQLAKDFVFLVRSLGGMVSEKSRIPKYTHNGIKKNGARSWRLVVSFLDGRFPASSIKHLAKRKTNSRKFHRSIMKIEPVGKKECLCIQVSNYNRLYLTSDFIPTHNSALAVSFLASALEYDKRVAFFSLEMSVQSVGMRLLSLVSGVPYTHIKYSTFSGFERDIVLAKVAEIADKKLLIDDTGNLTSTDLRTRLRSITQKHGPIDLIIVDYLQLMRGSSKATNREQEISSISRDLKAIAKEYDAPVIALAQLNRALSARIDKRPQLTDLRDSGSVEQDADIVMFIHRDNYAGSGGDGSDGPAELLIRKHRNGECGLVELDFKASCMKFQEKV